MCYIAIHVRHDLVSILLQGVTSLTDATSCVYTVYVQLDLD